MKPDFILEVGYENFHYDFIHEFTIPLYYQGINLQALDGSVCFLGSIVSRGPEEYQPGMSDALSALVKEAPRFDQATLRFKEYSITWLFYNRQTNKWELA